METSVFRGFTKKMTLNFVAKIAKFNVIFSFAIRVMEFEVTLVQFARYNSGENHLGIFVLKVFNLVC